MESAISIKILTTTNVQDYCKLLDVLLETHKVPSSLLKVDNMNQYRESISQYIDEIVEIQSIEEKVLSKYDHKNILRDIGFYLRRNEGIKPIQLQRHYLVLNSHLGE